MKMISSFSIVWGLSFYLFRILGKSARGEWLVENEREEEEEEENMEMETNESDQGIYNGFLIIISLFVVVVTVVDIVVVDRVRTGLEMSLKSLGIFQKSP
jgi:uncharacterized membrane protein